MTSCAICVLHVRVHVRVRVRVHVRVHVLVCAGARGSGCRLALPRQQARRMAALTGGAAPRAFTMLTLALARA